MGVLSSFGFASEEDCITRVIRLVIILLSLIPGVSAGRPAGVSAADSVAFSSRLGLEAISLFCSANVNYYFSSAAAGEVSSGFPKRIVDFRIFSL